MLNKEVTQMFLKKGIPAWPIQTSASFSFLNGKFDGRGVEIVKLAIQQGYVPILHGDLVIDNEVMSNICSGDLVTTFIAKKMGINKILFASDVDGIFISDPSCKKSRKCARVFNEKCLKLLDCNVESSDHSGGMMAKVDYIRKNCPKIEVVIFDGLKRGNFKKAFLGRPVGTLIKL